MSKPLYSVAGLLKYIKGTLDSDANLQSILVKGEISNFTNHRSGHWYFSIKDSKAKISCVMFASYASRCKLTLKEGMKVIVSASVSVYEVSGTTQLYVTGLQQDGLGDLYLQLEAVKEKMRLEGCFDIERKKALPLYPMNIGVITAKTGAAIQDILTTIQRRWPICDVHVYPSLVQGSSAVSNIIENLEFADQQGHDVILLARGGGAIEDLWCFNDEQVARTILAMQSVIVTGIGHETDTTLVDYVSDARAPTPTASAELITPDIQEVASSLQDMLQRMKQSTKQRLLMEKQKFSHIKQHRYLQDPYCFIQKEQMTLAMHVKSLSNIETYAVQQRKALDEGSHRLASGSERIAASASLSVQAKQSALLHGMKQFSNHQQKQFMTQVSLLDAFSPLQILKRGYSIAYHEDTLLKSIDEVSNEDHIRIRMQDGILNACVTKKEKLS